MLNSNRENGVLYPGIPFDEYLSAPGVNSTALKDITRSPAHHVARMLEPKEPTPALEFGKLLHYAVLEPEAFATRARIKPKFDRRTKIGKEADSEFTASVAPDDIVVPSEWGEKLHRICAKVQRHPVIRRLLAKGTREGTFWWMDERTGLLCKARPDFASETGILVDLKTTEDAREDAFSKAIWNYRYDIQAAHYTAGAEATGIARGDAYAFIAVEKEAPYEMCIYTAGITVLSMGNQWRDKMMDTYKQCAESGVWPGYSPSARPIGLPLWAKGPEDEDEG
jgi:PDDEXK-like domain of unknown function (DUF3799)